MLKLFVMMSFLFSSMYAFSCSCVEPGYTEEDAQLAAINFMETKRGVDSKDLRSINSKFEDTYLTLRDRALIEGPVRALTFLSGEPQELSDCEIGCTENQNRRYSVVITYVVDEDTLCTQDLIVKMQGNYTDEGFKSIVEKNTHPVCE